jgi:hypothetical protein
MKNKTNKTALLRIAALLLFPLWGLGGLSEGLSAQVTVSNMTANYPNKVSFTLTWTTQPHENKIWVIVDYIKIEGATTVGSWSRATIAGLPVVTGNATAATDATTNRGFWLNTAGATGGSANVTATLSLAAGVDKFDWCAYALNAPPTAVLQAGGGYELKGSPPFVVNGTTLGTGVKTFGAGTCIISLTDATDNPTFRLPDAPTVTTSNPAARCGAGAVTLNATAGGGTTTSNTYTWIVDGGAATTTPTGSLTTGSLAVGSRTYSVMVTNANGCTSTPKTGTITVNTAVAQATITGNASNTCPAATVSLSAAASGATTFTWLKNGSSVQSSTSSAYTVTASGSYTVQGKNANCTGTTSAQKVVTINACGNVPGCTGFTLYQTTASSDGSGNWITANSYCTNPSRGARLPTRTELECMCSKKGDIQGGYKGGYNWSSTVNGGTHYIVGFNNCNTTSYDDADDYSFRCVK